MAWLDFFVCLLFGILGVHKFREGRIGMGILYLLTGGLFGIGWLIDTVRYLITAINSGATPARRRTALGIVIAVLVLMGAASCNSSDPTDPPPTAPVSTTAATIPTEPTTIPTTAPTEAPTTAPTTAPTVETVHVHDFSDGFCAGCGTRRDELPPETQAEAAQPETTQAENNQITYILNTSSKKFHEVTCNSLPTKYRQDTTMSRDEILDAGYVPCKVCNP